MSRSHTPKGQRSRERILVAAERLIAARGFYGTSMRDVAAAARLPLASTIYHFARKEHLYAALLEDIAAELDRELDAALMVAADASAPIDALAAALLRWVQHRPQRVRLLVRELLDNPSRVARAAKLPLAPFLARMTGLVVRVGTATNPEIAVLHFFGALSYYSAAWPTVERMLGPGRARRVEAAYDREAIAFARRTLGTTPEASRGARTATSAGRASARSPRA